MAGASGGVLSGRYDPVMPEAGHIIFVYGTLKRGDVRAPLLAGQCFLGEARTAARYRLFNTGSYPALVEADPLGLAGVSVLGELWRVDAACLDRLDVEEGLDEGLYARRVVELLGDPTQAESYFYLPTVDGMADCGDCWGLEC